MNTLVVVRRYRDGRLYPVGGRLPEADHQRAINLVHALRCRDRLSYRQVVARLADEGLRVSVGSVHAWSRAYTCRYCRPEAF